MEKVAKYSILNELGRGSQGVVYHAIDVDTQRQVALKVIKVDAELPDDDPELLLLVKATEEQAKKLSEIEHRNVARVFEVGYQDGMIYIAREMIDGKTLRWLMEDTGKFKVEEAVELIKDIAKGVKAIHQLGVILGELKPSDIVIRPGIPVIVGLGVPAGYDTKGIVKPTRLVEMVVYNAPEVIDGSPPTPRSDIYTLGIMLYSMLAGANPFTAGTVANALVNIRVKDYNPIEKVNTKVPLWLARIVKKATSRDPEQRYGSVDEFLDELTLRSILKETGETEVEGEEAEPDFEYMQEIKPRPADRRKEFIQVSLVIIGFIAVIWLLAYYFNPARYEREAQRKAREDLVYLAKEVKEEHEVNPEGFDLVKFIDRYYPGGQAEARKHYSLLYNEQTELGNWLENLSSPPRHTFTVLAFPRDEESESNLGTFAIREDGKLRIWKEGRGEFDDVTTWDVVAE